MSRGQRELPRAKLAADMAAGVTQPGLSESQSYAPGGAPGGRAGGQGAGGQCDEQEGARGVSASAARGSAPLFCR